MQAPELQLHEVALGRGLRATGAWEPLSHVFLFALRSFEGVALSASLRVRFPVCCEAFEGVALRASLRVPLRVSMTVIGGLGLKRLGFTGFSLV